MPVVTAVLLSVTMITRVVKVAGEGDISEQSWRVGITPFHRWGQ